MKWPLILILLVNTGLYTFSQQQELQLTYSGSALWNNITDMEFSETYAFCAASYGLWVLDVSNPDEPIEVSRLAFPDGRGQGIALGGSHAYLADLWGGLKIIDISDPSTPFLISEYFTPKYTVDIAVNESYAYAADVYDSLFVLDISNPEAPTMVGSCDIGIYINRIALKYPYVYVVGSRSVPLVVDVSSAENPTVVDDTIGTNGEIYDIVVSDSFAYVGDYYGLEMYDISAPAHPEYLNDFNLTFNRPKSIAARWPFAYVAFSDTGLIIVDVGRPEWYLIPKGGCDIDGVPNRIKLLGNFVYISTDYSTLQILWINPPDYAAKAGEFGSKMCSMDADEVDDKVYLAGSGGGLRILDVSQPGDPRPFNHQPLPISGRRIEVDGILAYMSSAIGLHIVNIFNPENPVLVSTYDTTGYGRDLDYESGYVYLAAGSSGLLVIDVTKPANPNLAGYCKPTRSDAHGVAVAGNYAYIADRMANFWIADISDPENPFEVSSLNFYGEFWDVEIRGDYAYAAASYSGLITVNISNPLAPELADSMRIGSEAVAVDLDGDFAYVAHLSGITVFDVSNPNSISLVAELPTPGETLGVRAKDNRLFIPGWSGFAVWNIESPTDADYYSPEPLPFEFELYQNNPNPFNASTSIRYYLSRSTPVRLEIFNVLGQNVMTLVDGMSYAGFHRVIWQGKNRTGENATSGIYNYRLTVEGNSQSRQMLLIK
jgi:hypothetical protein